MSESSTNQMHLSVTITWLLLIIFYLSVPAKVKAGDPGHSTEYFTYDCSPDTSTTGNYTSNSTYLSNLNQLFSALRANSTATNFAAGTVGTVPNQVTGIAMCRGDLNASACSTCLSTTTDILNLCPYSKTALMWYNSCYMYFSSRYFLSSKTNIPPESRYNIYNVTNNPARFDKAVLQLMSVMKSWAINNSTKFFATGTATNFSTEYPTIYGLVQCTPDLTKSQCQDCLQEEIMNFPSFVNGSIGARTFGIHCNIRYEVYTFYDGPVMVHIDGTVSSQGTGTGTGNGTGIGTGIGNQTRTGEGIRSKKKDNAIAIAIAIPVAAAVLSSAVVCFCLSKKRSHGRKGLLSENVNSKQNMENADLLIDISTLKAGTLNFHESNKLGEGGFGAVYKGILPNGEEVAIKRLSQNSGQGLEELKNELVLVAKLQHKNLVRVVGICLEKQEKILVYEFVPNGSLDTILFDNEKRQELDWRKRQRIINGLARGLQYLHEDSQLTIIHRDLKASNILLDSDMNPKISDFGLARLFRADQTAHATRQVVGTYGYMAPEYAMHGLYSIKSDVYSFGVLLLEILTGRGNCGSFDDEQGESLLSLIWEQWIAGTVTEIMDPMLDCPMNEIIRHVQIGLLCVQENPADRPRMSEIVIMFSTETVSLEAPSKPAFYLRRGDDSYSESALSVDKSLHYSQNDVSILELGPR